MLLKSTIQSRTLFTDIVAWLFIALWIYAATSKLLDHEMFVTQLGQSPLLTQTAPIVAWLIPLLEIVLSLLLISGRTKIFGFYSSFGLMVMFTSYIIIITHFSDYIPCSCGGILEKMTWNQHLVFNVIFIALAAAAVLVYHKDLLLQQSRSR